ncbi:hypothetical protein QE450_004588 [Paenibacillus sp. SORGH_AS306]|nr:hypothetical protein [Paenibacillus sp. SORGH_AS_0306]MDR6109450.1 hypothetical protein [Paenibacillus sp. SORGH_AS_0338]
MKGATHTNSLILKLTVSQLLCRQTRTLFIIRLQGDIR